MILHPAAILAAVVSIIVVCPIVGVWIGRTSLWWLTGYLLVVIPGAAVLGLLLLLLLAG